jgi:hypothetical protein
MRTIGVPWPETVFDGRQSGLRAAVFAHGWLARGL